MRKAPDIWPRWTVGNGNGLHPLQLKIGMRAAQLLKMGGRLVYSTCTFNPIEDEAVVAAMLKQAKGSLKLLDMSGELPLLRRVPGVKTWEVWDKFGKHDTFDGPEVGRVASLRGSPARLTGSAIYTHASNPGISPLNSKAPR
jgi:16S rRNA C967 or C1407 C5-methylase (RsmB/RsmF family)